MSKDTFLGNDFLLETKFATELFHKYAKGLPIVDYHCHLDPKTIFENQNIANITKMWISEGLESAPIGDHYKWRLMRAAGFSERVITGEGSDWEKFLAFAKTLESAFGNPIYEWSHLELKRFFGVDKQLNSETADELWDLLNTKLQLDEFKPRNIIAGANVEVVVTTDDPIDSLEYHTKLASEEERFRMLPGWRPDKAMNIFKPDFNDYIRKLGEVAEVSIISLHTLTEALSKRLDFFQSQGAKLADHGIEIFYYARANEATVDEILRKQLSGAKISDLEIAQYHTYIQKFLAKEYAKRNIVMQMHINALRDLNTPRFEAQGPNTGHDALTDLPVAEAVRQFFDDLEVEGSASGVDTVPRTILFSLNDNDWMPLITIGCTHLQNVGGQGVKQKFQLGPGWWFNDTYTKMVEHLEVYAEESLLGNFTGMLTDSRSLLSYTRHEYFRRILCNFYGNLAKRGQIPHDLNLIGKQVQNISYHNSKSYFGL
ncbi:MAG: glucuronate isomerase [Candidatus Ancillula sp.]|nr:glucuronate isomerase [Candidatus Ancillula sp.]